MAPACEHVVGTHDKIDQQVIDAAKRVTPGGQLWVTDISCSAQALEKVFPVLQNKDARLGIYEHHISRDFLAQQALPDGLEGEIIFDLDRCGAKVFYEAMVEENGEQLEDLDEFIQLTNDRDLWINADIRSAELSSLHGILGEAAFIRRFVKSGDVSFTEKEKVLLNYEKELLMRKMDKILAGIQIGTDAEGHRYGVVRGEGRASEVCNAALLKFGLEYVCMLDFHSGRASIRSRRVFDCAKFSEKRGGGGHSRAAGFPLVKPDFQLHD